ncbi:MAG: hypothetical protein EA411_00095 [Saprospirales bacterium]|nr:MAG: hypothetical protein EA411_00095 [Saprospirales bacterium]
MVGLIKDVCRNQFFTAAELGEIFNRGEDYIKRKFLGQMIESGELEYRFPEMKNHPSQAYRTSKSRQK